MRIKSYIADRVAVLHVTKGQRGGLAGSSITRSASEFIKDRSDEGQLKHAKGKKIQPFSL